jgi:hypothetical protein
MRRAPFRPACAASHRFPPESMMPPAEVWRILKGEKG